MILESPSLSGLRSHAFIRLQVFFSVLINLAISEIWLSSSTYDFSPTNEAQFLDTAVYLVVSMYLLTRTQSRSSSGVAPHLESSERNDTEAVLLQRAVLLQIWNTQSCCSGAGPDLAHLEISPRFCMILESSSLSGLRSHFWDFTSNFFFSALINRTIPEIWSPSSTYDFSPTREAESLDTAVVYVSHIPLRLVSEQTGVIYFSSAVPRRVQQYYRLFTALLYNCSIFYTATREPKY